ncbi:MAG TPA: nuclear transport factor 2 family protein, partial [Xanthomonadales bacterium]|nr:nuclear transport factor 2 family protein [Xanthomonadales bacterium]
MIRVLVAFALLFAVAALPAARANDDVVAHLKQLSDAWDRAIVAKDADAVAANMAADFRLIRSNGSVVDRSTFLQDILSPALTIEPYTVDDFDVRVYGDVALLSGTTRMTGRENGKGFA